MQPSLTEIEARILGALVEKSLTTPEQYPLSLNAIVNACNQKTSRDPVMSLDEAEVGKGLFTLLEKGLAGRETGSRVPKFVHYIGALCQGDNPQEVAAIAVLLLRGPQTPGEIKTRTDRLCEFAATAEVEALLQDLSSRPQGPLVERLPRQPGQKEARYRHLLCGAGVAEPTLSPVTTKPAPGGGIDERIARLEKRLEALEEIVKSYSPPIVSSTSKSAASTDDSA